MRSTALLVLMMLWARVAFGEPDALVVEGKSRPRDQEIATRAISDALRSAGWVLSKPLSAADNAALGHCFKEPSPSECVLRLVHDRGVRRVAFVSIDPDGTNSGLQLTARLVVANVDSVMTSTQFCDHCTDDTIANSARAVTQSLVNRLSVETGRTVLAIHTMPQGARYSVDGDNIGATDATINIIPGSHNVSLELEGYDTATRIIEAREGKTTELSVTLYKTGETPVTAPTPGKSVPPGHTLSDPKPHSLALPIGMVVVGGVAVIGGAIALAFNGSSETAAIGQPQRQYYYETTVPGLVAIGGGIVVAGIGGYLWWHYTRMDTTPAVTPVSGGAVMSVSGSF